MSQDKQKILIVDDEPGIARVLGCRLESWGYEICSALSGKEALEKVEEIKPDLVLLDVILGDAQGFDICRRIRNQCGDGLKIIMCTAKIDGVDAKKAREAGADHFAPKTGEMSEIKRAIQNLL